MIKKFLGVLLTILVLSSSVALTAYAEDNPPAGSNPATNDEANAFNVETFDYKSLINSMENPRLNEVKVEDAKFITVISENEKNIFALVYATGYPVLTGIEYTEIGDYVFASAISKPDTLGLYVVWFSKYKIGKPTAESEGWYLSYVDTLKNAGENGAVNMREVYHAITKAQKEKGYLGFTVEHKDGELGEKIAAAVEERFGTSDYQEILGEIGENKYLVYCANRMVQPAEYEEVLGLNLFENNNYVHTYPLGLYVIDGDKAYSLKEAYNDEVINGDELGRIIKLAIECKYINYALVEPPYPYDDVISVVTKEFGAHDYCNVLNTYGDVYLVRAYNDNAADADFTESIANYTFYVGNRASRYELGLYIVKGDKAYTLKQAYLDGVITYSDLKKIAEDVNSRVGLIATEDISYNSYKAMADKYGEADYLDSLFYNNLGYIGDINVISASTTALAPAPYTEKLGAYEFKTKNSCYYYPLGIYIIRNNKSYTLKEAYDKKVISDDELGEIAKLKLYNMHESVEVVKTGVNDTAKAAYIKFKSKKIKNFELDMFEKLKDGIYIAHQKDAAVSMCSHGINIDKYTYWVTDEPSAVYIFDYRNYKEYALDTAFEKGIITKTHLKKISELLDKLSKKTHFCPTLYENEEYVSAGEKTSPYQFDLKSVKKMTISNKKVVKFVSKNKGYVFVGLKKGTATVKLTPKKGKPIYKKIVVKYNPKLTSKKGKTIKTLSVKLGKTAKVYIKGKAGNVNNKYKNTKYAKVTSKKNAKKISVQGLKRGTSTIKVVVNNVALKLKVKVK